MKIFISVFISITVILSSDIFAQGPTISFGVTGYLTKSDAKTLQDTSNWFYKPFNTLVREKVKNEFSHWKAVNKSIEKRISVGFRIHLVKDNHPLDTLPYAVWDICMLKKIDFLVVFYLYNENEHQVLQYVGGYIPIVSAFGGGAKDELSDENINYYLSAYNVKKNKSIYSYYEDIDDLLERTTNDTEEGAVVVYLKKAFKKFPAFLVSTSK